MDYNIIRSRTHLLHTIFPIYGVDKNSIKLSFAEKEVIALEFMHIIAYRFINKKRAITMYELAKELRTAPTIITEISTIRKIYVCYKSIKTALIYHIL